MSKRLPIDLFIPGFCFVWFVVVVFHCVFGLFWLGLGVGALFSYSTAGLLTRFCDTLYIEI